MAKKDDKSEAAPLITIRGDLKQRDVRTLELEALEVGQQSNYLVDPRSSSYHEAMLKAAIGAGWVLAPVCRKEVKQVNKRRVVEYYFGDTLVDDLEPRLCYAAADAVVSLMVEFTSLDPTILFRPPTSDGDGP